jgi:poly(hydroxyalkanoate) granule-associated protein
MAGKRSGTNLAQAVTQSGNEIWLAGVGAFSTARKEGSKLFDLLVEEGRARTRALTSGAGMKQMRAQATGGLGKLERIFEERLTKTLKGIGVPTAQDVSQLSRRVAELDKHVAALTRREGGRDSAGNGAKRAKRKARR